MDPRKIGEIVSKDLARWRENEHRLDLEQAERTRRAIHRLRNGVPVDQPWASRWLGVSS